MSSIQVVRATPGFVECTMKIQKIQTNRSGNLHGGMICSLVDSMGSLALASKGLIDSGVSTDIHTTFIRSAGGESAEIRLEGRVLNMGQNLAYTETKLFSLESGKLLATGLHTKFVARALGSAKNVTFDETGEKVISQGGTVLQQQ